MTKPAFIQTLDQALICAEAAAKGYPEADTYVEGTVPFVANQIGYISSTYQDMDDADTVSGLTHIGQDAMRLAGELGAVASPNSVDYDRMVQMLKCAALVASSAACLALAI